MNPWIHLIDDYIAQKLPPKVTDAFIGAMERYPDLREEVKLRTIETKAMDRFKQYTKDKPQDFPDRFPGTKLYFASLFSTALFMGTFSARLFPPKNNMTTTGNRPEEEKQPEPGPTNNPQPK